MIDKEEQEEPLVDKEQNKSKKKIILIILAIIGVLVTIGAIIIIVFITKEKYDDTDNNKKDDQKEFEYGLTLTELQDRTNSEHLGKFIFLNHNSEEYTTLQEKDKQALKYLVKAAMIMDEIALRLDNVHNIPFKKFLESELKNNANNTQANLTKILFDSQKGINGIDSKNKEVNLAKNYTSPSGMGVYPEDLTEVKFHEILTQMINDKKEEEVIKILNQRSIVEWDKDKKYLIATDYIDYFQDNFTEIAYLLSNASEVTTDDNFKEYLKLQADALKTANPNLDVKADKKWVTLQDTTLELTLVREPYRDTLTESVMKNEMIKQFLINKGLVVSQKDLLGFRVGIVNKNGSNKLLNLKKLIPNLAQQMPNYDKYKDKSNDEEVYQNYSMVDVDIIKLTGIIGAYRGQINCAELLPNDNKQSVIEGSGKRFVFHRQMKSLQYNKEKQEQKAKELLNEPQNELYDEEAFYWYQMGMNIAQKFGPKIENSELGEYKEILEYNKAYLASFAFIDQLNDLGFYESEELVKKIKISSVIRMFLKEKPNFNESELVNKVIINNILRENNVYQITNGKIVIYEENIKDAANTSLTNVIDILLNNNKTQAEEFYKTYFEWSNELNETSKILKKYDNELHFFAENELADYLLKE